MSLKIAGTLALLVLAALVISPIWVVAYPPLLDYPNHLASSYVLAHLHDPSFPFDQWYGAKWGLYPYLAMDVSMRVLQWILPVELAGRVYLSLMLLAFPLSTWFFLRQANPGQDSVALWGLVATHNIFFLLAFLNFYVAICFSFLALGLWLKWLARPRPLLWLGATAAMTALYFSHLIAFAITGIAVTGYGVIAHFRHEPGAGEPKARSWAILPLWQVLFPTWLTFAPGAAFYLLSSRVIEKQRSGLVFLTLHEKLTRMHALMQGYSERLDYLTLAAFAAYFLLAWISNREVRWNRMWLAVSIILLVLYWGVPAAYGDGADLDLRVLPILFAVLLAVVKPGRRGWYLAPLVLVLFLLRVGNIVENYRAAQPELASLARSFAVTPRDVRVLPIVQAEPDTDPLLHSFAHFWAYGVIRKHWFSPYLFELRGLNPLVITQGSYTLDGFWDLEYTDTPDWGAIQQDYDYVWNYNARQYDDGLAKIGVLIYSDGKLRMYRVRHPD
ncbi:MAG: hypothetical protein ACXVZM_02070 [Terriglobales bacterium]